MPGRDASLIAAHQACVGLLHPMPSGSAPDRDPGGLRDPLFIRELMPIWGWLHRHYFRVHTSGWEHVPGQGPMLLVGSHNGGLATPDLPMFLYDWFRRFGYQREVYGLTHAKVWQTHAPMARLAARVGAIPFYPRNALAVLEMGHSVLVYPGGGNDAFRPHRARGQIHFGGRTGFIRLALWHSLPIIPLISWGSHDTLIVLEDCYRQVERLHRLGMPWLLGIDPEVFPIYLGLPWGLALGPLPNIPLPARIHTRVCAPIQFERTGYAASRDRGYVQACYQQVVVAMQAELDNLADQAS
ncbi:MULTISPECIES: lysophospholipid acyltransferase family protein [Synechococcales]|uniref:lysophospholipid acyltransferase family protein n=1 Tax=Synechococcus sp. CS-1324 TaxID=2847980 RepID=UPI00223B284A|nr:lysophospholipid acyltransferase family protein [Synechococcus sp. CS-1324]